MISVLNRPWIIFALLLSGHAVQSQVGAREYLLDKKLTLPKGEIILMHNPYENTFFALTKSHFYQLSDEVDGHWDSLPYRSNDLPAWTDLTYYNLIELDKKFYLVANSGGIVLEFIDSSLIRIDDSFDHRNQFGSVQFPYDHRILAYAGYGLFTVKDFITEFTLTSREWNIYDVIPNQTVPPGRYSPVSYYDAMSSQFYMAGGRKNLYSYTHHDQRVVLKDVWRLDLDRKKWHKLGRLTNQILFENQFAWNYQQAHSSYYIISNPNQICGIDFISNRLTFWEDNNAIIDRIYTTVIPILIEPENYLFCATQLSTDRQKLQLIFIPQQELLHQKIKESRLYVHWGMVVYAVLLFLLAAGGGFLAYRRFKKYYHSRNLLRLRKSDGRLIYQRKIIPLAPEHKSLLKFLATQPGFISNVLVSELFYHQGESEDVVKKRKMAVINQINQKVQEFTGLTGTLILERQGQPDRRFKEYALNREMVLVV